jgi:hypothetical protein
MWPTSHSKSSLLLCYFSIVYTRFDVRDSGEQKRAFAWKSEDKQYCIIFRARNSETDYMGSVPWFTTIQTVDKFLKFMYEFSHM